MFADTSKILVLSAIAFFLSLSPLTGEAVTDSNFKLIALDKFMQGRLDGTHTLLVPVPKKYEEVVSSDMPFYPYSYWMRPDDMEQAIETESIPTSNGHMYGDIKKSISYDHKKNIFVGIEDEKSLSGAKKSGVSFSFQRFMHDNTHIIVIRAQSSDGMNIYGACIALETTGTSAFLVYRPANNRKDLGEDFLHVFTERLQPLKASQGGP